MSHSHLGVTMKVFVYFNLHKKVFSIKSLEGDTKGLVIGHSRSVRLTNATFKVSEAGRQRVLKEKRKNVHAGVMGEWFNDPDNDRLILDGNEVTYNPYKFKSFVRKDTLEEIRTASEVQLIDKRIFI